MMAAAVWAILALVAATVSALAAYRYITMTCDGGVMCGGGVLFVALAGFGAAMLCASSMDTIGVRSRALSTYNGDTTTPNPNTGRNQDDAH